MHQQANPHEIGEFESTWSVDEHMGTGTDRGGNAGGDGKHQ
jgi:hypothetical protein